MSNSLDDLRDLLDDAVRERAMAVRVDAASAWREGRRRRTANRLAVAAVTAVAVVGAVMLSSVFTGLPAATSPADGAGHVAGRHPERLEHAYWDDEVPRVTGPLAGVVRRSSEDSDGWYAVSSRGHLWRLPVTPDAWPSLSPDGSHLGYLRGSFLDAVYVIVDQVDGTTTTFPQIGSGAHDARIEDFDDDHRFFHSGQTPSFWSPDGTAVLLRIGLNDPDDPEPDPAAGVARTDGTFTAIPQPPGARAAHPVGWVDEHHVVLLARPYARPAHARVWVIDVRSGRVVRDFTLEDAQSLGETSQWSGSISPDGNELAVRVGTEADGVRFYAMGGPLAGEILTELPGVAHAAEACQPSWSSSDHYVAADTTGDGSSAILVRANGGVTVVADPRLDIVCSTWARTALDGPAHQGWGTRLFGHQDSWVSWHWRELAATVLLACPLLVGAVLLARRRTGRFRDFR